MHLPARRALAAFAGAVLLFGCTGQSKSEADVRDDITDDLVASGTDRELALLVADCVTDELFSRFDSETRDDIVSPQGGDAPNPSIVEAVEDLVDRCTREAEREPG